MLENQLKNHLRTTEKHLKSLQKINIEKVKDLLYFFPRDYRDLSQITKISEIQEEKQVTLQGLITRPIKIRARSGRSFMKSIFVDETDQIEVLWFGENYLLRSLRDQEQVMISGKIKINFGKKSLMNPAIEKFQPDTKSLHQGRIVPIYPESGILSSTWIRGKIKEILDKSFNQITEHLPKDLVSELNLMPLNKAIYEAHFPSDMESLQNARYRLAFDELFILQLQALQKKWQWQRLASVENRNFTLCETTHKSFVEKLPFALTKAQERTIKEILEDMKKPYPMSRLVQGDVGSGKTIVATTAILQAIKNGYQTSLMAPTEILAKQHFHTIYKVLHEFGFNIKFLSGATPASEKKETLTQLRNGSIDLIIGTHALIQDKINFHKLGLAIIDEQHRFGVKQREILKSFGSPHFLSLSATPIPRTLAMTIYGDQDLSIIDEMPANRKEIITRLVPENKRTDAYHWIESEIKKGRQVFVICPLVEESDSIDLKSVTSEYARLQEEVFPNLKITLIHGKMPPTEKEQIMAQFKAGDYQILVATSVIEVGIDIPNASIILIEGSERFGLSQLHQFRGRVGRGEHQSYCFLFTDSESENSKKRLNSMVKHSSGFKLAEIDLHLRGPGEVYGVKQSGIPNLKIAKLTDSELIHLARESAMKLIEIDPWLKNYPELKSHIATNSKEQYFS
jgi:ATP-dependent DNA helicase RecG